MLKLTINRTSITNMPELTSGCLQDVAMQVAVLRDCYPQFDDWMNRKVLPGLYTGERSILVEYRRELLAGFAIVKDDGTEKKLCCLRVIDDFQKSHGLGVRLFERSFEELNSDKPLLSVAEERLDSFKRIFGYFGFKHTASYEEFYRTGKTEYAFNGYLNETAAPRLNSGTALMPRHFSLLP